MRTLKTSDPAKARSQAAVVSAAIHDAWERTRAQMAGTYMGRQIDQLEAADLIALKTDPVTTGAALAALSPEDNAALARRVKLIVARAEVDLEVERRHGDVVKLMAEVHDEARSMGIIEGLKQAIAAGGALQKPTAHADAARPWHQFLEAFFKSRPGMSASTRTSYHQAFREWQGVIGEKNLADLEPRDIARYAEWLERKENARGSAGILNRKTLIRLTGHVRTFTAWTKTSGLLAVDPGIDVAVRKQTRTEKRADDEGSKRAFTREELVKFFDSPLFTGCYSRHYRHRPGPHIYRDAAWWLFVTGHMTGGRIEELAQAPSALVDLNGVLCIDLQHGTKTPAAPRLVPITPELLALGFAEMAERQRLAGLKLFEGEGASADWSKWCNRYIDKILGEMPEISFHSFRHAFRQACSAAQLGDYLCDKLLGHRSKKDRSEGSGYGKLISPAEAKLVFEKLRSPIPLNGLSERAEVRPSGNRPLVRPAGGGRMNRDASRPDASLTPSRAV